MMRTTFLFAAILLCRTCMPFPLESTQKHRISTTLYNNAPQQQNQQTHHGVTDDSRRIFGTKLLVQGIVSGAAAVLTLGGAPSAAIAKVTLQEKEDKERLVVGVKRLNYLLDNWEKETTICGQSDNPYIGLCERNPIKVMDYMGYKSTADPLFKADKTLKRLSANVSPENGPDYLDAMEKWAEAAEEASGMAYVSSWGEANPGGGKDRVEYFIERAKKNVIDARDSLVAALEILEVSY